MDNCNSLTKGYAPWRYRLYLVEKTLKFIKFKKFNNKGKKYSQANKYLSEIKKIINEKDCSSLYFLPHNKQYFQYCFKAFDIEYPRIIEYIKKKIDIYDYKNHIETDNELYDRIHNKITPNSIIEKTPDSFNEKAMDIIHIIQSVWLYIINSPLINFSNLDELEKYGNQVKETNLLGLKAIELSQIQNDYNTSKGE